jgi:hypothetical protein
LAALDETMAELDAVEERFLRHQSTANTAPEIRRRVAEWKFKLAVECGASKQQADRLHAAVSSLGFSDLESEATIELYYAQFHAANNDVDRARQTAEALRARIDQVANKESVAHLERDIDSFLSGLR